MADYSCYCQLRDLHSFPTRRSSDLDTSGFALTQSLGHGWGDSLYHNTEIAASNFAVIEDLIHDVVRQIYRSEEHTSELQSRRDLVCRLLLEKKKPPPRSAPCAPG